MKQASVLALAFLTVGAVLGAEYVRFTGLPVAADASCRGNAHAMAQLELIFGTARAEGAPVTDAEWKAFLDGEVTPRFPQGLTVLRGPGQWRSRDGRLVEEDSRILIIWYEPTEHSDADIEAIRSAYKTRFAQESVMRIDGASCVSF